jgi:NADH:ubiquinone oxidoreductase subunit 6 (subunit J)
MLSILLAADGSNPLDYLVRQLLDVLGALARQWPIWVPLLAGALAVYLLLPRPRSHPALWGAVAGLAALVLGGLLLVTRFVVWQETLLFYSFSGIAVVAGALLVTQRNPARAALAFALVVLSTSGLFLLLAAPFLMAASIIIYAGAIIVTFLFVIMLAQQEGLNNADARSREPLLAVLTGFVLLWALLGVLKSGGSAEAVRQLDGIQKSIDAAEAGNQVFTDTTELMRKLGFAELRDRSETLGSEAADLGGKDRPRALRGLKEVVIEARERLTLAPPPPGTPSSALSGPAAGTPRDEVRREPQTGVPELPAENSAYLGVSLFTDFLLPVELGGLLLVATVGAIAIVQRHGRPAPPDAPRSTGRNE